MAELERLAFLEQQAEEAYAAMYEAHSPSHAAACYGDAKEALYSAITIAQDLRADDAVKRLEARLAHIKAVFRSAIHLRRLVHHVTAALKSALS
jgi:hypothetical protein